MNKNLFCKVKTSYAFENKQFAFTLAEVLITLGIIGVVAALTMPTLTANYKNKILINQSKNSYSKLSNALILSKEQNGFDSFGDLFGPNYTNDEIIQELSKSLQMTKICKVGQGGCWNWKTKNYSKLYKDGKTVYYNYNTTSTAVLNDGSVISVWKFPHNGGCEWTYTTNKRDEKGYVIKDDNGNTITESSNQTRCAQIILDVNGAKGPNQFGADTWDVGVYAHKLNINNAKFFYNDKLNYSDYREGED